MIIDNITIKNFKSFGNNTQTLKLSTTKGELILLTGKNGSGKTSLLESIDYVAYNKVKAKNKKWMTLSTLPNRLNKELFNTMKFTSGDNTIVEIKRGQNPSKLELWENGVQNDRAGKNNINAIIESYIGMDIEAFKSFISMSINDFKNFISLSSADKKLLLDKMFNLEVINIFGDIIKKMNKDNKLLILTFEKEIAAFDSSIKSIKESINNVKIKRSNNNDKNISSLKESMTSGKVDYKKLSEKISKINTKSNELNDALHGERTLAINAENDIKHIDKQLSLYDGGKCPTCKSDLSGNEHIAIKSTFVERRESTVSILSGIKNKVEYLSGKRTELNTIQNNANSSFVSLKTQLISMKSEYDKLLTSNDDNDDLDEFFKTIDKINKNKENKTKEVNNKKDKLAYHAELLNVFSDNGVKKSIIKSIISPINHFIKENISYMSLPFDVTLDSTFNATITQLGNEIETESLSTGEMKKINVSIMLAYLKLIRTKRSINILFLDEVFSSIDVEGIGDMLSLLKDFANDYNINIFVVHHAILENTLFDRVISLQKNIFSQITEVYTNDI